jgi:hypothetical protein
MLEGGDAAVEAGNKRARAVGVDRNLARAVEIPADERGLP